MKMTIREAARQRRPLGVADTQALEGALTQCEDELKYIMNKIEQTVKKLKEANRYIRDAWCISGKQRPYDGILDRDLEQAMINIEYSIDVLMDKEE